VPRPIRNCRVCGAEFESSRADFTVNCPAHRGRPPGSASSGYEKPPVDRFALGRAHGLQGLPRLQTGMIDYHRGYDQGQDERRSNYGEET
jgi:hypothetical protein